MNCSNEWEHWEHHGSTIFKKSAPIEKPINDAPYSIFGSTGSTKIKIIYVTREACVDI